MRVIRNPQKLSKILAVTRHKRRSIGFVPTMGALHLGHLSLIKKANKENNIVVVSIFVNPKQFGPKEDFKKYPRQLKKDLAFCRASAVDFVFLPSDKMMYPEGYSTFVNVEGLSAVLCGASRPGHFRGVATIVAKLLNIICPDALYLGQKDAQQAIILKKMVKDLNFPTDVKVIPTVRQKNGLALSSRNAYLDKKQASDAVVLSKALSMARSLFESGARDSARIISRMRKLINKKQQAKVDYISIVDLERLEKVKKINRDCLVALAVRFGNTRLIDNTVINYA
ncbi:MAG: pantoate--beta-alanine ligase [Candidatus Omnitrophica bacterium]|nr:pantoate--beta-alanine ligase [Candidatus Omnitrophota bacterium]MDD5661300.1 pantoate--beta-alanine ligase [Candidatus Omnitrophota bacterium]